MQQITLTAVLSMIGMLLLMLLVFVGAYYASKFLGRGMMLRQTTGSQIEVLDRTMIDKDKSLLIVRVAGKLLLLGAAQQSIQLLAELDEGQLKPQDKPTDFLSTFKDALRRQKDSDKEHL